MSSKRLTSHPMQPIVWRNKVIRFKENAIVRWMLDRATSHGLFDLNVIAQMNFSREDRMHLSQLIGYSVSGYGDLYPASKSALQADLIAAKMAAKRRPKKPRRRP